VVYFGSYYNIVPGSNLTRGTSSPFEYFEAEVTSKSSKGNIVPGSNLTRGTSSPFEYFEAEVTSKSSKGNIVPLVPLYNS
jgi:hypothetical protein